MVSLRQEKNRKWSTLKIQKLNANLTADSHLYLGKWLELRQRQTSHEFPGGAVVKNLPASAGDTGDRGSIPGAGRSPGGENGSPLQYYCLENSVDRGAWWATVHEVTKSQVQLSTHIIKQAMG